MAKGSGGLIIGLVAIGGIAALAMAGKSTAATPTSAPGTVPPGGVPRPGQAPLPSGPGGNTGLSPSVNALAGQQQPLMNANMSRAILQQATAHLSMPFQAAGLQTALMSPAAIPAYATPGGCQLDSRLPDALAPAVNQLLTDPNADPTQCLVLAQALDWQGYPMAANCLRQRAASQQQAQSSSFQGQAGQAVDSAGQALNTIGQSAQGAAQSFSNAVGS